MNERGRGEGVRIIDLAMSTGSVVSLVSTSLILPAEEGGVGDRRARMARRALRSALADDAAGRSLVVGLGLIEGAPGVVREDLRIARDPRGRPFLCLPSDLQSWFDANAIAVDISLAHDRDRVLGVVGIGPLPSSGAPRRISGRSVNGT